MCIRDSFGGTCLNVGCIPSKALLDSSHRYYEANKKLSEHGIQIESLKLDLKSMMKRKDDIVGKLTGGISGLFSANKVESMIGRGKVIDINTVEVTKPDGSIETIDAIRAMTDDGFEYYLQGNIMKYLWRYRYKNGVEDLKKAQWYLNELIDELEKDES